MAIRLRTVSGVRVALCAVETDPHHGDVYLDDADHYALAAKLAHDMGTSLNLAEHLPEYQREWAAMASQKVRDAEEELETWMTQNGG